jgi:hypothetical protein
MFGKAQEPVKQVTGGKAMVLHSIAGMLRTRKIEGGFETAGNKYRFTYSPKQAVLLGNKLQLNGSFEVTGPSARTPHSIDNVKATLLAIQGGIGNPPQREKLPSDVSTKHPDLPIVESTGSISFSGVLYFKLSPLDARALGVAADMSQLQLNVRLAPVSDTERALQAAFSSIADSLYGQQVDSKWAESALRDLNKLFAAG